MPWFIFLIHFYPVFTALSIHKNCDRFGFVFSKLLFVQVCWGEMFSLYIESMIWERKSPKNPTIIFESRPKALGSSLIPPAFGVWQNLRLSQAVTTHDVRCTKSLDIRLIFLMSGRWIRSKCDCFQRFFKFVALWSLSTDIWLIFRCIQQIILSILLKSDIQLKFDRFSLVIRVLYLWWADILDIVICGVLISSKVLFLGLSNVSLRCEVSSRVASFDTEIETITTNNFAITKYYFQYSRKIQSYKLLYWNRLTSIFMLHKVSIVPQNGSFLDLSKKRDLFLHLWARKNYLVFRLISK